MIGDTITNKQQVLILSVLPETREITARMRDGAVIQLTVIETGSFFRWPKDNEFWTVYRQNYNWYLGEYVELDPTFPVENLDAGDAKIFADTIYTESGFRLNHTGNFVLEEGLGIDLSDETIAIDPTEIHLDQWAVPTSPLNLNGQKIISLGAPTDPSDAVRLQDIPAALTNVAYTNASNTFTVDQIISSAGADALRLTANDSGITFGGDTNLYRGGGNLLKTDDGFVATLASQFLDLVKGGSYITARDALSGQVMIGSSGSVPTITFGTAADTNLYRSAADTLKTDDTIHAGLGIAASVGSVTGQVAIGAIGPSSAAAVNFGSAQDTNLYRSAANVLSTDDGFTALGAIATGSYVTTNSGTSANWALLGYTGAGNGPGLVLGPALDTNLYCAAANTLKTDDHFVALGNILSGGYVSSYDGTSYYTQLRNDFTLSNILMGAGGAGTNTGDLQMYHYIDSLLFPAGKQLNLGRSSGASQADPAGSGVGDKLTLFGSSLANRYGIGVQSNAWVAYMPSGAQLEVRAAKTTAQASTGATTLAGIYLNPLGAVARFSNLATLPAYDSWGRTAAEAYHGIVGSTTPTQFFSDGAAGDQVIQSLAGTIRLGVNALGSASQFRITSAGLTSTVPLAMSTQKITGLSAATANGDAVRFEQLSAVTANPQTIDYTLVLADAGKVVEENSASPTIVTVPPNSSVAFPVGTVLSVVRLGAGTVTMAAGVGVTINSVGGALAIPSQYGSVALRKQATDTWHLTGV